MYARLILLTVAVISIAVTPVFADEPLKGGISTFKSNDPSMDRESPIRIEGRQPPGAVSPHQSYKDDEMPIRIEGLSHSYDPVRREEPVAVMIDPGDFVFTSGMSANLSHTDERAFWEEWRNQFCTEIQSRMDRRILYVPTGCAMVSVTVTRGAGIDAEVDDYFGDPRMGNVCVSAIAGMSGNPGLAFPVDSTCGQFIFSALISRLPDISQNS